MLIYKQTGILPLLFIFNINVITFVKQVMVFIRSLVEKQSITHSALNQFPENAVLDIPKVIENCSKC